jgi:hypothetical protein
MVTPRCEGVFTSPSDLEVPLVPKFSMKASFDHSRTTGTTKIGKSRDGKNHIVKRVGGIPRKGGR